MCTRGQCSKSVGQWVHFRTPWGYHRGVIQTVNNNAVLVRMPRSYAPAGLVNLSTQPDASDEQKLDLALTQYGAWGGGYGWGGPGYGASGGWGKPGWGGWRGGWWWWWLAFAWIFALAFLW